MTQNLPYALVAVDVCVFAVYGGVLHMYVMPWKGGVGKVCFPGGLIETKESAEEAVHRIIKDKTDLNEKCLYIEQLATFSKVNRDARGRVVSVAYLGAYNGDKAEGFVPFVSNASFAYDHNEISHVAKERLESRLAYTSVASKFLDTEFTYSELKSVYDAVTGVEIDKRNFRKKFESLGELKDTNETKQVGRMRPATLYKFIKKDVHDLKELVISFK